MVFVSVILIYMQHYQDKNTKRHIHFSVYLLRKKAKDCHGVFTRTLNPYALSEVRLRAGSNCISGRIIREWTPSLRNPRNDSCRNGFSDSNVFWGRIKQTILLFYSCTEVSSKIP